MRRQYQLILDVTVHDKAALFRAASKRAKQDGLTRSHWLEMRRSSFDPTAVDIQMLLDPGVSPDGISITNGEAVTLPATPAF